MLIININIEKFAFNKIMYLLKNPRPNYKIYILKIYYLLKSVIN